MSAPSGENVSTAVRRGLVWSTANILVLRLGNLLVGIVLARLLLPADFGVFAIGLTVLTVLSGLADLSMSVDLVRAKDPEHRAPTVATISIVVGVLLALCMTLLAKPLAVLLNEPDSANVIMVLSWTLVLTAICVVPFAHLQRNFQQKRLFATSVVDFAVGTAVTIGLVKAGMGPMALAIGRIVAQAAATVMQFVLAGVRPRFGFDRVVARSALAFGIPLAGANMLSWALLNIDNIVIAQVAGATALGLYVLAFNVSSWPMNAIGQAVRGVSLAGFSAVSEERRSDSLIRASTMTWAVALPVGVLLATLSGPLIALLYGQRWSGAAGALAALGLFGSTRVLIDLVATFLIARGAARPVLYVQIVWFAALIPAEIVAAQRWGIAGAGWAHLAITLAVVVPAYGVALARVDGAPLRLLRALAWPTLAAVPTWYATYLCASSIDAPLAALVLGGLAGTATCAICCFPLARQLFPDRIGFRRRRARRADQPQMEGV